MTREELVAELKATREAAAALGVQVTQFDLAAKRAHNRDPDLGDVAALHAEDLRASLEAITKRAAFFAEALARSAGEAGPKGGA